MAIALNKQRMLVTRLLVGFVLFMVLFTSARLQEGTHAEEMFELLGYTLLIICALGRVFTTSFIGGMKNQQLITEGPYSVCRNPLYFFSLVGVAGLGVLSMQLVTFLVSFLGFLWVYDKLIEREEGHLAEKFGATFERYKREVPRLWPDFRKYKASGELLFQPKYLAYAVRDAVWWFLPYPVFDFIKYLQDVGVIKPLFTVF